MRGLVVALLVACSVTAARAESDDTIQFYIVFVGQDAELVDALELVMEGNNTGVKAIGDRATPSLAELGPESRRLADGHKAIATVWLSATAAGATLVTYERGADRFVVREVPYKLPLDATQAAETARMVRVMLRAVGDRDDEAAISKTVRRLPVPRVRHPHVSASAGAGAWFGGPEAAANLMTTVAIAWRPHGLGAAISATLGSSTEVVTPSFRGDVRVIRLAAEARKALQIAPDVRVSPGVGVAIHSVSLSGSFGASDLVSSQRYNAALGVATVVGIALPHRVELGLSVSADCLLQRQRYATGTEQILDVPRIQAMMAILVGIRL